MTTKTSTKKAPAAKPAKAKGPSKAKMAELEARITAETEAEAAKIAAEQAKPEAAAPATKADGRHRPDSWVTSTTPKPTKKVWVVAEEMPGASRKEVIAECIKRGIAPGTSRTQYQAWFKVTRDSKPA